MIMWVLYQIFPKLELNTYFIFHTELIVYLMLDFTFFFDLSQQGLLHLGQTRSLWLFYKVPKSEDFLNRSQTLNKKEKKRPPRGLYSSSRLSRYSTAASSASCWALNSAHASQIQDALTVSSLQPMFEQMLLFI